MKDGRTPAERRYRLVAGIVVGRALDGDRLDEMAAVFGVLWGERCGRPVARIGLLLRELTGLLRTRRALRRRRAARGHGTDWQWRDRMGEAWRDFRIGLRALFASPVATLAAVTTLALGIGGTTAVFSVADGVLLHPLNYPDSDELVLVLERDPDGNPNLLSPENFHDLQRQSRTLEALAAFRGNSIAVTGLGEPECIRGEFVSASYFDVLGGKAALGRVLAPGEDVPGGDRTVVLAHGYWQTRFNADPEVLGRTVNLNSVAHTIVGVMPPEFRSYWDDSKAWISMHTAPGTWSRGSRGFFGIGRLADGVDVATADRELMQIMDRLADAYPDDNADRGAEARGLAAWVVGDQRRTLVWSLLGTIGLVLLIATFNVASLQLARASQRSREMAIRSALGGGRRRLLMQLLIESLTLALLGGMMGVGIAILSMRLLLAESYSPFASFDIRLNASALGMTALLTLGVGVLAGLVPALRGSAAGPASRLRDEGRGESASRDTNRFRSGLVVAQMGMAVTLLVGASLLLRTIAALQGIDVGFDADDLLTAETRLTAEAYEDDATRRVYLERVVASLDEVPGVRGATLISGMPFSGDGSSLPLRAEGSSLDWDDATLTFVPVVAQGYFDFMGIPLVAGRTFELTDGPEEELAVVASRSLAERLYPGADPLGRMVESPEGSARIVGVVEDTRRTLTTEIQPTAYLHYLQSPPSLFSVLLRTDGAPETYVRALREAFWSVDANQPLWEVVPLRTRMAAYSSNERFLSVLVGSFAGLALLLAAVGMYGVMAHAVGRRRRELGIRIALGAGKRRILRMVLRQGIVLTTAGAVVGVAGAAAVARLLGAVLFGVGAFDPLSFVVPPVLLVLVAVGATYLPARRATRVDPVEAFRS